MPDLRYLRRLTKRFFSLLVILGGTIIHPALAQTSGLRLSIAIDPQHLELATRAKPANQEHSALLRLEWQAAQSRIDEAATLDEMLKRLGTMETTTRQLLQLLKAMPSPSGVSTVAPAAPRSTTAAAPAPTLRETPPPNLPANDGFDIASSLPLSLKLIGAVTLLLALSLAAYRWLLTHTPQTDLADENKRARHPPYLRGGGGTKRP